MITSSIFRLFSLLPFTKSVLSSTSMKILTSMMAELWMAIQLSTLLFDALKSTSDDLPLLMKHSTSPSSKFSYYTVNVCNLLSWFSEMGMNTVAFDSTSPAFNLRVFWCCWRTVILHCFPSWLFYSGAFFPFDIQLKSEFLFYFKFLQNFTVQLYLCDNQ